MGVEAGLFKGIPHGEDGGDIDEDGEVDPLQPVGREGPPAGQVAQENQGEADGGGMNAVEGVGRPAEGAQQEDADGFLFGRGDGCRDLGCICRDGCEHGRWTDGQEETDQEIAAADTEEADNREEVEAPFPPEDGNVAGFHYAEDDHVGDRGGEDARAAVVGRAHQGEDQGCAGARSGFFPQGLEEADDHGHEDEDADDARRDEESREDAEEVDAEEEFAVAPDADQDETGKPGAQGGLRDGQA